MEEVVGKGEIEDEEHGLEGGSGTDRGGLRRRSEGGQRSRIENFPTFQS